MATSSTGTDQIDNWVSSTYGATPATTATSTATPTGIAAPTTATSSAATTPAATTSTIGSTGGATTSSTTGGMLGAAATTTAATPAATSSTVSPNVSSWYESTLGRDGDAAGISYWQNALANSSDPQAVYNSFVNSASTNKEDVKTGTSWADANNYTGTTSGDKSTVVDDWGQNVLGRALTGTEQTKWSAALAAATTPAQAQAVYQQFLASEGTQVKSNLDLAGASQIATPSAASQYSPSLIDPSQITTRTIDPKTETVAGQINTLLAADSPVLQQARAQAMTAANDRGLLNSSLAASGGENAVVTAATGIGTTDAGAYNAASNYNAAAQNQELLANQTATNSYLSQTQSLDASAAQQQASLASQAALQSQSLASSQSIAQMQADTSKYSAELSSQTSKYNTDSTAKQQTDANINTLANNIINNMDLSPDRKAAMLESLGKGTSAKTNADGTVTPGTGLAGAVYVIGSTTADLTGGA